MTTENSQKRVKWNSSKGGQRGGEQNLKKGGGGRLCMFRAPSYKGKDIGIEDVLEPFLSEIWQRNWLEMRYF